MRRLLITEYDDGRVKVENDTGVEVQSMGLEKALVAFAHRYGLELSEVRSGFDVATYFDTFLGVKRQGGQIHEGAVSG